MFCSSQVSAISCFARTALSLGAIIQRLDDVLPGFAAPVADFFKGRVYFLSNSGSFCATLSTLGFATLTTYALRGLRLQKFW